MFIAICYMVTLQESKPPSPPPSWDLSECWEVETFQRHHTRHPNIGHHWPLLACGGEEMSFFTLLEGSLAGSA